MKKVTFDYSLKNIPIPEKDSYLKILIDKTQSFIQRLRWKVYWIRQPKKPKKKETHGFKTDKCAPQDKELVKFENDLINMISNVEFKTEKKLNSKTNC